MGMMTDTESKPLWYEIEEQIGSLKDSDFTVDVRDGRAATSGRPVTRIVGEHSGVTVELADIDHVGADGSLKDWVFEGLPGTVIDQRDGLAFF